MITTKLGIIGFGNQIRREHLPYLNRRRQATGDVELAWVAALEDDRSSFTDFQNDDAYNVFLQQTRFEALPPELGAAVEWEALMRGASVDGVLVSLPNKFHAEVIEAALHWDVHVAVEKPTTIRAADCERLVATAREKQLVFVTICQRRYEDMYMTASEMIARDQLGDPQIIDYLIIHQDFGDGWIKSRDMSGGGALISSGYHAVDTVLWLLAQRPHSDPVRPKTVSCLSIFESSTADAVESVADVRVELSNGGVFNLIASFAGPQGSLDENIKMFGHNGAIRMIRDRPRKMDQSAGTMTYQHHSGAHTVYDTKGWGGARWAPVQDFVNAVQAKQNSAKPVELVSPASDSLMVIKVIEAAYRSASENGKVIEVQP